MRFAILLMLFLVPLSAAQADSVVIYTEDNPPYNFRAADGYVDGVSVRLVERIMKETGLPYEIRLVSWVRAMRNAQMLENSLIFSLARVESRIPKFYWLVPIADIHTSLYGRHDDHRPVSLDAIRDGQYTAVCPTKSVECDIMRTMGFPDAKVFSIALAVFSEQYEIVQTGRVDFMIADPLNYPYYIMTNDDGYTMADFKEIMRVGAPLRLFLAAGKQIRPDIKQAVEDAYARLIDKGYKPITPESAQSVVEELMNR